MRIAGIAFSLSGAAVLEKLREGFENRGHQVETAVKSRYLSESISLSAREWCGLQFKQAEALIVVGATGIAVRSIAPYVRSKKTDPAVLVVDERGKFVISLLSGHLGGANALAAEAAALLGAQPVITTATDLNELFAVDVFAREQDMAIHHMKAAKEVSAALLAGETVGVYSEFSIDGGLPKGICLCDGQGTAADGSEKKPRVGFAITVHTDCKPFPETTALVPRAVTLGIGCRKGKAAEAIEALAKEALAGKNLYPESVRTVASIDVKAKEPGILAFCEKWGLPFVTYGAKELQAVEGSFTPSSFVQKTVGVDNVCERSALLSGGGVLIQNKLARDGVTIALALADRRVTF